MMKWPCQKGHLESFNTLVMKHCLTVLQKRKESNDIDNWIWERKERVAHFILRKYQEEVDTGATPLADGAVLTEDQRREVERTHPLLQTWRPATQTHQLPREWTRQITAKVKAYVAELKKGYAEQTAAPLPRDPQTGPLEGAR